MSSQAREAYEKDIQNCLIETKDQVRAIQIIRWNPHLANQPIEHYRNKRPLHIACEKEFESLVKMLVLEFNVPVDALYEDGFTVIHLAAVHFSKHPSIMELILAKKPHLVNQRSEEGVTPLMSACVYKNPLGTSELLRHGADRRIKTCPLGINALHYSALVGSEECCRVLINKADKAFLNEIGDRNTALGMAKNKNYENIVQLLREAGASE